MVVGWTDTDWVENSGLTGRRHFELTADRRDGSPAGRGVLAGCFCCHCSLISPPALGKMNRLFGCSLEAEELLLHCREGKMLISGYVWHVLWKKISS